MIAQSLRQACSFRARAVAWVATAGAAVAGIAPSARAQVLDAYFAQPGLTAGDIPADQSRQLVANEYTPPGIRAGSFIILPQLLESVGYDSDVNGLGIGGSPVIETNGNLVARSDWSLHSLAAQLTVDDRRYPSQDSQSTTSWSANLGGTYDLGHDQAALRYSHLDAVETPDQIGSIATTPVPYRIDIAAASYRFSSGSPVTLIPGVQVSRYDFNSVSIPDTGTTEAWRNRVVADESLMTRYSFDPGVDGVLVLQGTEIRYDQSLPALPRLNSDGGSVLGGLDYQALGPFTYRLLAGYQVRSFAASVYKTLAAPIAEASVTWTPTRLTTVTATLRRDIEDSASQGPSAFTYTAVDLRLLHELRRNVVLTVGGEIQRADSQATPAGVKSVLFVTGATSQTIESADVGATWRLNRNVTLTASGRFVTRSGEDTRRYTEETGLLTVGLAL